MTTTAPHPTQLLLAGQAAAPDGPIDLAAMYLMHHGFRRDLHRFADVAPTVPASDRARWRGIDRRFRLFASILLKHHRGEDAGLWPLLAERGADPTVLDALEAEHAVIDPLLEAAEVDLRALADGTGGEPARARFSGTVTQLRDALCAHLGHEESDGMTQVQRHLTPEDWSRLDHEVFAKEYTQRELPAVVGWLADGLTVAEMRRMPGANTVLLLLARLMGRRFARRDSRLFGGAR